MTKEKAIKFFSEFYHGIHHFPNELRKFGRGWYMDHYGDLATIDYNRLTILVFMAHRDAIRVEIQPTNKQHFKICIFERVRDGGYSTSHPTMEEAIRDFNLKIRSETTYYNG